MKYPDDFIDRILCGNTLDILKQTPNESIDCVITSPPYWALRDYQTEPQIWDGNKKCQHEWKNEEYKRRSSDGPPGFSKNRWDDESFNELRRDKPVRHSFCSKCNAWRGSLGLEPTFELYLKHLWQIFDEIKRVLKKTGTCWVVIGDTYGGSGCGTNDYRTEASKSIQGIGKNIELYKTGGIAQKTKEVSAKSLCQIPSRFAIGMTDRGWILRNELIWYKPNCMPSSAKDRFTVDFEKVFFFVKNRKYWFEQQFENYDKPLNRWGGPEIRKSSHKYIEMGGHDGNQKFGATSMFRKGRPVRPIESGRNKRCVWQITTKGFPGAHFAVFPEALVEPMIKAGCPEFICKKCGLPRYKIYKEKKGMKYTEMGNPQGIHRSKMQWNDSHPTKNPRFWSDTRFVDYSDCGCNAGWDSGIVLDPFAGAGTTCVVAKKLGRNYIGIDLNPDYVKMANDRLATVPDSLFKDTP